MDPVTYREEAATEASHWWFVERRRLIARTLAGIMMPAGARVLDVGISAGGTLAMLGELGYAATGIDSSAEAIALCRQRGLTSLCRADICRLPFADGAFDCVVATDVIEHVDDDAAALNELARVLSPRGWLVLTVPAFQLLWSRQDDLVHHKRRYRLGDFRARVGAAGLAIRESYYFNYLLFPLIFLLRRWRAASGRDGGNEIGLTPAWLNPVLAAVFRCDIASAGWLRPPFGVSIFALAGKAEIGATVAAGSPERFGYEWAKYSEMRPDYEEQFGRWTAPLKPADWLGKSFLDVGCGMGRNSVWPFRYGARRGVAVDVDARSLDAARRNLVAFPTAEVREVSAYDLPYRDEFDIAFSIGVIHHLERPERALAAMVDAVRPGGKVLIWVYGRENNEWIVRFVDPLRRALFSRLPVGAVHHLSLYPSLLLWLALRLGAGRTEYFRLARGFSLRHLRSIVFDQMLPRIAHYWPRHEVARLMQTAGLVEIQLTWVNEMSWSAIGTKPAAPAGLAQAEPALGATP